MNQLEEMNLQAEIYFAGGCFWGTEHFMKLIKGVEHTEVGYANSLVENPDYPTVCTGTTGAAETVKVVYNPSVVSLRQLIELFFRTIDPTTLNRQGGDIGTQYRTGIYYVNAGLLPIIEDEMNKLAAKYTEPIVVEVLPLENFYPAEAYHQHYLDKNPGGYCHIKPELFALAKQAVK
jgi:peptide methionine sulfoxide reductase msrA/msrB